MARGLCCCRFRSSLPLASQGCGVLALLLLRAIRRDNFELRANLCDVDDHHQPGRRVGTLGGGHELGRPAHAIATGPYKAQQSCCFCCAAALAGVGEAAPAGDRQHARLAAHRDAWFAGAPAAQPRAKLESCGVSAQLSFLLAAFLVRWSSTVRRRLYTHAAPAQRAPEQSARLEMMRKAMYAKH